MVKVNKNNAIFIKGVVIANGIPDSDGDTLNKREIKQLMSSFLTQKTDTNHDFLENFGVRIIENYATKTEETIADEPVPIGSWVAELIVWDEDIKQDVIHGKLNGLSLASQTEKNITKSEFINKRATYSQYKDLDTLTPTFISIVKNAANGFKIEYCSYEKYITKSKQEEAETLSEEQALGNIANKLLDAFIKQNKDVNPEDVSGITKAAAPQGGVAPVQQPPVQQAPTPQQPQGFEQFNQKLDTIISLLTPQVTKSKEETKTEKTEKTEETETKTENKDNEDRIEKAEQKTNDATKSIEETKTMTDKNDEVPPFGKSDVPPSTKVEGSGEPKPKEKHILKSQDPQSTYTENVVNEDIYSKTYIDEPKGTPRDALGRPILQ